MADFNEASLLEALETKRRNFRGTMAAMPRRPTRILVQDETVLEVGNGDWDLGMKKIRQIMKIADG